MGLFSIINTFTMYNIGPPLPRLRLPAPTKTTSWSRGDEGSGPTKTTSWSRWVAVARGAGLASEQILGALYSNSIFVSHTMSLLSQ